MRAPAVAFSVMLMALAATGAAQAETSLSLVQSAPAMSGTLPRDANLYLEIAYDSDIPVRIQAEGYRNGAPVTDGQRMNATVVQPAGKGRALAWISFGNAARIDEVRVSALSPDWQPLATAELVALLQWTATPATASLPRPDWVEALIAAEQKLMAEQSAAAAEGGYDIVGLLVGFVVMLAVPGWIALQIAVPSLTHGAWRLAALLPLVPMGGFVLHALFALSAGSNLWPLMVILAAPFACLYLIALLVARAVTRPAFA